MNYLRIASKKHNDKIKTVMIILSEREANRILLSSSNLLRNPFLDYEEPKMKMSNESWYEFIINQIEDRWRIKKKLFALIPTLFSESDQSFNVSLTNLMFNEIKKKRCQKNILK